MRTAARDARTRLRVEPSSRSGLVNQPILDGYTAELATRGATHAAP
ncbi:hypothetical protein [Kytococcus sp. Marseille-QA3725]